MHDLQFDHVASPIGEITLIVDQQRLCLIDFRENEQRIGKLLAQRYPHYQLHRATDPHRFSRHLTAYFDGDPSGIRDLPLVLGGTPFQQRVWQALCQIPLGEVRSYGQLATLLGNPNAARAVGLANSLNPISIVVPCHRVIGANATLTGYAGGLERKRWLLNHEQALAAQPHSS
ncbi:MAG: methylated-DNA--[protein]-cysteine S-methyltransferase [Roseiflexaceae bacterium]